MKKYTLFNEWRARSIYGESFSDAILREKNFLKEDGAFIHISSFIGYEDVSNATRGNSKFIRGVFETSDGKVLSFDATEGQEINGAS